MPDSLTRRPFCEAFSESEAQAIVSIVWNHGVALFRSSKLADSQRQMKRAIQLMRMLLPNKFEKKLAEVCLVFVKGFSICSSQMHFLFADGK
jgi:GH24 family phage-related lysozyme (muramidase)